MHVGWDVDVNVGLVLDAQTSKSCAGSRGHLHNLFVVWGGVIRVDVFFVAELNIEQAPGGTDTLQVAQLNSSFFWVGETGKAFAKMLASCSP